MPLKRPEAEVVALMKLIMVEGSTGFSVVSGASVDVSTEIKVGTSVVGAAVAWVIQVVVSISSGSLGMNGYLRHGNAIGGPSMFSNTYPTSEPAVRPVM